MYYFDNYLKVGINLRNNGIHNSQTPKTHVMIQTMWKIN